MAKFKLGDRVRIVKCNCGIGVNHRGRTGGYYEWCTHHQEDRVNLDYGYSCHATKVELVKPKAKKVGRPKGIKNKPKAYKWELYDMAGNPVNSHTITFQITRLDNGTEVIRIPDDWKFLGDITEAYLFRKAKK